MASEKENLLQKIAIFTAVPADLIAIVPVLYTLLYKPLQYFHIVPEATPETTPFTIGEGFRVPLRDFVLAVIFYGFIASFYWFSKKRPEDGSNASKLATYLRDLSLCITLILGIPIALSLGMFNIISILDGLAVAIVFALVSYTFWKRWGVVRRNVSYFMSDNKWLRYESENRVVFRDIGFWYLIWIPIVFFFLEFSPSSSLLENIGWAWIYTSSGYVASLIIALFLSICFLGHEREPPLVLSFRNIPAIGVSAFFALGVYWAVVSTYLSPILPPLLSLFCLGLPLIALVAFLAITKSNSH